MPVTRLPEPWDSRAAKDRLSSTLFLAGLFHAILILGITFSGNPPLPDTGPTTLDVVLITKDYEPRREPDQADLLAQQNMIGAGNTSAPKQLSTASRRTPDITAIGPEQPGDTVDRRRGAARADEQAVIVAEMSEAGRATPDRQGAPRESRQRRRMVNPGATAAIEVVNEPAAETLISDTRQRELIISANTRESRIAAYLNNWKRKVERIGTLNFPRAARSQDGAGHPTLEVAITADGTLREVVIRKSSGERGLDQAAMNILRSAAPFDPFPEFLRSDYDVLRFSYEWRFTEGGRVGNISAVDRG